MPDFEALIRHQQLKQPKTNQRLKVVDSPNFEEEKNEEAIIRQSGLLVNFFGGFIGSVIGTLTILFLYINKLLSSFMFLKFINYFLTKFQNK